MLLSHKTIGYSPAEASGWLAWKKEFFNICPSNGGWAGAGQANYFWYSLFSAMVTAFFCRHRNGEKEPAKARRVTVEKGRERLNVGVYMFISFSYQGIVRCILPSSIKITKDFVCFFFHISGESPRSVNTLNAFYRRKRDIFFPIIEFFMVYDVHFSNLRHVFTCRSRFCENEFDQLV